jgi:NurA-like 5'-3' nuclease
MNKAIVRVEAYKHKTINQALDKAKADYEDTRAFYEQTGYDRYYKKMNRLELEIEELEAYIEKDQINEKLMAEINELECERIFYKKKLQEIKKDLLNRLFYLLKVIPECSEAHSLEFYIQKLDE